MHLVRSTSTEPPQSSMAGHFRIMLAAEGSLLKGWRCAQSVAARKRAPILKCR